MQSIRGALFIVLMGVVFFMGYKYLPGINLEVKGRDTLTEYRLLNEGIKNYKNLTDEQTSQLLAVRKENLLADIKDNPNIIKEVELPQTVRNSLPKDTQHLVEKEIEIETRVNILHSDNFINKESKQSYRAKDKEGKGYNVYFLREPNRINFDSDVKLSGLVLDTDIVVENVANVDNKESLSEPLTGARDALVIRFNWQNDTSEPFTAETLNTNILAEGGASANEYFKEVSYNKISFPGDAADITDWYTIAYNSGTGCSTSYGGDVDDWTVAADAAATGDGHILANYDHFIYIFPDNPSCGWAGLGTVGDDWDGSYRIWSNEEDSTALFTHELGHNIWAGHANTKDCGTKSIDVYANCVNTEYGDRYDTMGGYYVTYHMNAAFKNKGEWLLPEEIQTVSSNGSYTINPIESDSSAIKAIKISKPNTGENYWLEYRQAVGLDGALPSGVTRGVNVRIYDDDQYYSDSYLLDMTPGVGSPSDWSDIALSDGASFTDETSQITIMQTGHDANGVTLSISFELSSVYRFWSNSYKHHFYTISEAEKNFIEATMPEWQYEGAVFYAYPTQEAGSASVYRFWSNLYKGHFYTISEAEKNFIEATMPEWQYEGAVFYAYPTQEAGSASVYRFWSNLYKGHFYTISEAEKNFIEATMPEWQYEGIGYYTPQL